MTAPNEPVVAEHDAAVAVLEAAAVIAVAGATAVAVKKVLSWLESQWAAVFPGTKGGGAEFRAVVGGLVTRLNAVPAPSKTALLEQARRARAVGEVQARRESGAPVSAKVMQAVLASPSSTAMKAAGKVLGRKPVLPRAEQAAVRDKGNWLVGEFHKRVTAATKLLGSIDSGTLHELSATVAAVQQASNVAEATTQSVVTEAVNGGIKAVAVREGWRWFWQAERDACLWCISLSGLFPNEDGLFAPDGFGAKGDAPYRLDKDKQKLPVLSPPLHNHCRCRLGVWKKPTTGPNDFPTLLRREAERSVLSGWSLESEPEQERVSAADRLLRSVIAHDSRAPSGWQVPASVQRRAKALAEGKTHPGPVPTP